MGFICLPIVAPAIMLTALNRLLDKLAQDHHAIHILQLTRALLLLDNLTGHMTWPTGPPVLGALCCCGFVCYWHINRIANHAKVTEQQSDYKGIVTRHEEHAFCIQVVAKGMCTLVRRK